MTPCLAFEGPIAELCRGLNQGNLSDSPSPGGFGKSCSIVALMPCQQTERLQGTIAGWASTERSSWLESLFPGPQCKIGNIWIPSNFRKPTTQTLAWCSSACALLEDRRWVLQTSRKANCARNLKDTMPSFLQPKVTWEEQCEERQLCLSWEQSHVLCSCILPHGILTATSRVWRWWHYFRDVKINNLTFLNELLVKVVR